MKQLYFGIIVFATPPVIPEIHTQTQMNHPISIEVLHVDANILGRGSSGDVHAAKLIETGDRLVVKVFNSMAIDRAVLNYLFHKNLEVPAHPGIAQIRGYQLNNCPYYVISERATGKPIEDCSSLNENQAWGIILQLAEIMGYAHYYGMIHGNLHPGNMMLSNEGDKINLKVVDFASGLLGEIHQIELSEQAFFAPPEQLDCMGNDWLQGHAESWDVYRFGAIAYWLLNHSVPRGKSYHKRWSQETAKQDGRPAPIDTVALAMSIGEDETLSWKKNISDNPNCQKLISIIENCLQPRASDRPIDMAEVNSLFQEAYQEVPEGSISTAKTKESKVKKKLAKHRNKLLSTRLSAVGLACATGVACFFLFKVFTENQGKSSKLDELNQIVADQEQQIINLGGQIRTAETDLKTTREAVDSTFHSMTRTINSSADIDELKRSKSYYTNALQALESTTDTNLEKARALHNLGLIEMAMQQKNEAYLHFVEAIQCFESLLEGDVETDTILRLADCHERAAQLHEDPSHEDVLASETMAVWYFKQVLEKHPMDLLLANRMAEASFRLGQMLNTRNLFDDAILAYTDTALQMVELRGIVKNPEELEKLEDVIAGLQFHAAESLQYSGRHTEAVDAYIATIESIERSQGIEGYSDEDALKMAKSFLSVGNLFGEINQIKSEDNDQVYNEALRLLVPLNNNDASDADVAVLMAQTLKGLADVERKASHGEDAYNLSVRGIETLTRALDIHPEHIEGLVQLADSRLAHLVFETKNTSNARRISLLAIENAEKARSLLIENQSAMNQMQVNDLDRQLRNVFSGFAAVFERWGDESVATKCQDYASIKLSYTEKRG